MRSLGVDPTGSMSAPPDDSIERQRYESPLARVARRWSLVPIVAVCAVFGGIVRQTEQAHLKLVNTEGELSRVQGELVTKRAAVIALNGELQRLQSADADLTEKLKALQEKSATQQKDNDELTEQGNLLWKLAAKDPPKVVSGKVIAILGAEDPRQRAQTLYLAGKIAMGHRDYVRADSLLSDAVRELPNYGEALNALGLVAARQGRLDDAEAYYLRSAAADGSYFYPLQNLASLYFQKKAYARARAYTQRALQLKPDHKQLQELLRDIDKLSPP